MTPTLAAAVSLAKAGTGVPAGHVSSLLSPGFQPRSLVPSFLAPISLRRGARYRLLCILSSFFSFLSLAEWSLAWGSCPHVVAAPSRSAVLLHGQCVSVSTSSQVRVRLPAGLPAFSLGLRSAALLACRVPLVTADVRNRAPLWPLLPGPCPLGLRLASRPLGPCSATSSSSPSCPLRCRFLDLSRVGDSRVVYDYLHLCPCVVHALVASDGGRSPADRHPRTGPQGLVHVPAFPHEVRPCQARRAIGPGRADARHPGWPGCCLSSSWRPSVQLGPFWAGPGRNRRRSAWVSDKH